MRECKVIYESPIDYGHRSGCDWRIDVRYWVGDLLNFRVQETDCLTMAHALKGIA
jgi:hypothetical protein